MITVSSNDVDHHLTPEILLSWVTTEWVKKVVSTATPVKVSGWVPVSREIMDDMKYLTHDEFVSLKQSLTDDQVALVLHRVAHMLREYERAVDQQTATIKRLQKTARRIFNIGKKKASLYDVAELLDIPTED